MRTTLITLAFALATVVCGNVHAAAPVKKQHAARAAAKPHKKAKLASKSSRKAHASMLPAHIGNKKS